MASCGLLRHQVGKDYTLKTGLKYKVLDLGHGDKPHKGQKLKVHYKCMLSDSSVFYDSKAAGMPFVFQLGAGQVIKGWDQALALFREGTVAELIVPPELGYGNVKMGKIPANETLRYELEFIEIITPPVPYDVSNADTLSMESGLQIIKVNHTNGKKVTSFRHVRVEYTGYLENGNIFDSSIERGMPFSFEVGKRQVLAGWDEAMVNMRVGEKARIIIPPELGYGEKGMSPFVPGDAKLIFDVEVLEMY